MSSDLAYLPGHCDKVLMAHSVADIETLVGKKNVDENMIIVWRYGCPKLAMVNHI